jgi:myo-inositol-1(or 4)-monophosphatase
MAAGRSAILNVMIDAAEKAGRSLTRDFGEVEQLQVSKKGPGDFVSKADHKSEKILKEELQKARPKFGFLLEEQGEVKGEDPSYRWIIDPLDGTTNFLHGIPHWAVVIGLEKDKEIVASVVYDPLLNELFHAEKGAGAFSNAKRLRVAGRTALPDGVIGVGDKFFRSGFELPPGCGLRRMGSAALAMAYVAAGRLDAYWEDGLSPWDKAAASLLVKEAGGYISELDGGKNVVYGKGILAANPTLHTDLLQKLKQRAA